jgi:hypothetical protein
MGGRYNKKAPYGPGNCYLQKLGETERQDQEADSSEAVAKWNKTVNIFRRAAGLPLFMEG